MRPRCAAIHLGLPVAQVEVEQLLCVDSVADVGCLGVISTSVRFAVMWFSTHLQSSLCPIHHLNPLTEKRRLWLIQRLLRRLRVLDGYLRRGLAVVNTLLRRLGLLFGVVSGGLTLGRGWSFFHTWYNKIGGAREAR